MCGTTPQWGTATVIQDYSQNACCTWQGPPQFSPVDHAMMQLPLIRTLPGSTCPYPCPHPTPPAPYCPSCIPWFATTVSTQLPEPLNPAPYQAVPTPVLHTYLQKRLCSAD
jgi:hypothetical protein